MADLSKQIFLYDLFKFKSFGLMTLNSSSESIPLNNKFLVKVEIHDQCLALPFEHEMYVEVVPYIKKAKGISERKSRKILSQSSGKGVIGIGDIFTK